MRVMRQNIDDPRPGEQFWENLTGAQYEALSFRSKRKGNIARDADGTKIPRAPKLDETLYPVFIQKSEINP